MYQFLKTTKAYRKFILASILIFVIAFAVNFIAASAVLLVFLIFKKKDFFLFFLSLFISLYIFSDNIHPGYIKIQNIRFVLLGLGLVLLWRYKLIHNNPANYILPFSLIAIFSSLVFSPLGLAPILRALSFWLVALVCFKMIDYLYYQNASKLCSVLVWGLTAYFLLNFVLFFFPVLPSVYYGARFNGLMGNPNGLGLLVVFSYGIFDLIRSKGLTAFSSNFFNFCKVLFFFLVVVTGSRTALFSLVAYEVISRFSHKKILMLILVLGVLLVYIFVEIVGLNNIINSVGMSDFLRVESLEDASGRSQAWVVAWEEIKRNPWLGKGINYDSYYIQEYGLRMFGENRARTWSAVWSSYFSLLLDVGFLGFLAYVFFIKKMYKLAKNKSLAIAYLVMVLFCGVTESWMAASMNAFTPLFFIYWAIQLQEQESIPENQ